MIQNQQIFLEMLGYKRLEETRRTGSDLAEKKFSDLDVYKRQAFNSIVRILCCGSLSALPVG